MWLLDYVKMSRKEVQWRLGMRQASLETLGKGKLGDMSLHDWHLVSWAFILFCFWEKSWQRWTTGRKTGHTKNYFTCTLSVTAKTFQFQHSVLHRDSLIFREVLMCSNFLIKCLSFRKQSFRKRGSDWEAKAIHSHNFSKIANGSTWDDQYNIEKMVPWFLHDFNLYGILSTHCLKKDRLAIYW